MSTLLRLAVGGAIIGYILGRFSPGTIGKAVAFVPVEFGTVEIRHVIVGVFAGLVVAIVQLLLLPEGRKAPKRTADWRKKEGPY